MRFMSLCAAGFMLAWQLGGADAATILNRPTQGEPESLDPQKTTSTYPWAITRDMFVGLIALGDDNKPVPGIAESWEISPDGKSWTFHLRHNAKWSNGDPLTADDFLYSFRRLVDPKTAASDPSALAQLINYREIQSGREQDLTKLGVDAPDPYTLHLTLTEPRLMLQYLLTDPQLFPLHRASIERWGNEWTRPGHIVSNGPYVMKDWVPQDQIVMVRNPNFFAADSVKIDEVHWIDGADFDAALKRYRAGELDWVDVRRSHYAWAKQNMADQLHHAPANSYNFLAINMTRGALAQDIRLREALNLATDRDLLVEKINPVDQLPAYSINPPSLSNYTTQPMALKDLSQAERIKRATELVTAAGYGPDHPLKLTVSYPTDENSRQVLLAIRQMLLPVGIELTLNNMEWQVYIRAINTHDFDIGFLGASTPYDDYENGLDNYRGDAGDANFCGYRNEKFDDLFHRGATATDLATRRHLMEEAERTLLADYPLIPLYFGATNRVVNPKLAGVIDIVQVPQTRFLAFKG
ncbi:MAG: peptide ABC transporter substrate-binding protein [Aliidongia sp.]